MNSVRKFNGDEYVDLALNENQVTDLDKMLSFINNHKNVYLFGRGKCGQGVYKYLKTCNLTDGVDFVTSDNLDDFMRKYEKGTDGIILSLKADYFRDILPKIWGKIDSDDIFFLRERSKEIFVNSFSDEYIKNHFWISLPIAKHCNINCSACSMYAPLCDCEFYSLESVKKDLSKIKEIGLPFAYINITGGEPFLNPEALEIIEYIRELYPSTRIDVYTNGVPLLKFEHDQFNRLKNCEIELQITEYKPTKGKLDYVYEMMNYSQISYRVDFFEETKLFFKKPIDLVNEVPITEYINCQYYAYCFSVFIFNGVVYKCATALCADAINKYAGGKLNVTEKDYLDLSNIISSDQIYDFWKSRLPMCRYCPRATESFEWKKSERKIEEWMQHE